jgi:hypothetical protein
MSRTPLPSLGTSAGKHPAGGQAPPLDRYQTALEKDFPRILMTIQNMWGYPELNTYFRKLTLDTRGDREGFPKDVWEEIFTLLYVHQMIVPESSY